MSDESGESADGAGRHPERQVLVVGDGVGGLALTGLLRQRGLEPVVAGGERDGGRGRAVTLPPCAVETLDELGLVGRLAPDATRAETWTRRTPAGDPVRTVVAGDAAPLVVERSALLGVLRRVVPDRRVRSPTTVDRVETRGDALEVTFDDGVRERFDLVVGADAHGAAVRDATSDDGAPVADTATWTFPVDGCETPDGVTDVWTEATGFTYLPGDGGGYARVTVATDDGAPLPSLDAVRRRTDVEWLLPRALRRVDERDVTARRVRRRRPASWSAHRVAFVGHAARESHPATGVGAASALADASALAAALTEGTDGLQARVDCYATRRASVAADDADRSAGLLAPVEGPLENLRCRRSRWLDRIYRPGGDG